VTRPLILCSAISKGVRFKHPFTCIIAGPTGSGRSTFSVRFLENLSSYTKKRFHRGILWSFSERASITTKNLYALNLNIRYHEGVPVDFKNPRGEPCLFILDDLLNDAYSNGRVCDLFTKGSHHRNITFILITQNIFHEAKHCRDISLNAKYLILLKTLGIEIQFFRLAQQVYPKNNVVLYDSYLDATSKPHGYLVRDLSQDINDLLRFRTEIFPDESTFPLVYAPIKYETDTIDLSYPTRS